MPRQGPRFLQETMGLPIGQSAGPKSLPKTHAKSNERGAYQYQLLAGGYQGLAAYKIRTGLWGTGCKRIASNNLGGTPVPTIQSATSCTSWDGMKPLFMLKRNHLQYQLQDFVGSLASSILLPNLTTSQLHDFVRPLSTVSLTSTPSLCFLDLSRGVGGVALRRHVQGLLEAGGRGQEPRQAQEGASKSENWVFHFWAQSDPPIKV